MTVTLISTDFATGLMTHPSVSAFSGCWDLDRLPVAALVLPLTTRVAQVQSSLVCVGFISRDFLLEGRGT